MNEIPSIHPSAPSGIPDIIREDTRRNIVIIVNFLAGVTYALAFIFGHILYQMAHDQRILKGATIEALLCIVVLYLNNYRRKYETAILLTFFIHCASTLYFGLILSSSAQVQAMIVFLIGLTFLVFQGWVKIGVALAVSIGAIVAIEVNYKLHFVETVPLYPVYEERLRQMVIATVVSLDCLMLYFYVRKVADYKQRSTAYMRELEQTKQAISRFVRESSHQIRIDLNGVSGALQHALAGTTKMDAMEQVPVPLKHLRAMYNGSNAVIDHINNALEWARIEQGLPFPIKKEAFDLHGWLDDMTERFRLLAENKPANLVLTQDGDLPKNIIEDKNRLGAIIGNLLANAIKFTHKHTTVTFDAAVREDNLLFSVTDQGKGMSAEQQIAVFEPFVTEANELVQGTGLGLPVARDLVQALGGTMEIYSTPGSGTTFIVRLPLTIAEATEVASVLSDLPEDFKGYSTLVVEDDYTSRMVTFAILKRTSMEVYTAETAAEAMRKLAYYKIDIVLLDFNLPDSNGLEVLKWIKTNPALKHVHVVFASAEAYRGGYSDKQKLAMDAGASAYMYKPLKFDELLLEFKRLLYSDIYTE